VKQLVNTVAILQTGREELAQTVAALQTKVAELELSKTPKPDEKLLLELQYYKNRKNEAFYQMMLEQHLGGTHKIISCGITDVTAKSCHAEIKEWKCWKEAVGQLTCYNLVDPKPELAMYMFGRYTESCKDQAVSVAGSCGFRTFEFKGTNEGEVYIEDCSSKEKVYGYAPPVPSPQSLL